jgi:hypothetical protein
MNIVYFMQSAGGSVKIGTTKNLPRRLSDLQRASGNSITVIRQCPGSRPTERWFHERFAEQRGIGEWFVFHPDMLTVDPPQEADLRPTGPPGAVSGRSYLGIVTTFVRQRYLPLKNAARLLAEDAGTTPRCAENWLAGTHAPNGDRLVNLMAANPDLRIWIFAEVARRKAENIAEREASRGTDPCGHSQLSSGVVAGAHRAG